MKADMRDWRNHVLLQSAVARLTKVVARAQAAGGTTEDDLAELAQVCEDMQRFA